jgi:hypothetical protein
LLLLFENRLGEEFWLDVPSVTKAEAEDCLLGTRGIRLGLADLRDERRCWVDCCTLFWALLSFMMLLLAATAAVVVVVVVVGATSLLRDLDWPTGLGGVAPRARPGSLVGFVLRTGGIADNSDGLKESN